MKNLISFSLIILMLTFTACNSNISSDKQTAETPSTIVYPSNVENLPDYDISENFTWQDYVDLHKDDFRPEIFYSDYFQYYFHHGTDETSENCIYWLKDGASGDFKYSVYENSKILITDYTENDAHVTIPDTIDGVYIRQNGEVQLNSPPIYTYNFSQ